MSQHQQVTVSFFKNPDIMLQIHIDCTRQTRITGKVFNQQVVQEFPSLDCVLIWLVAQMRESWRITTDESRFPEKPLREFIAWSMGIGYMNWVDGQLLLKLLPFTDYDCVPTTLCTLLDSQAAANKKKANTT